jgi:transcriptional regulator with XRE-family HTH domain
MVALPFCRLMLTAAKPKSSSYPAVMKSLGDHLRARRLELGLTQLQVAVRIICDQASITNWELHRVEPALRFLPRIIEFLGYDPAAGEVPSSLGARIRAKRRRLGLSIRQLAQLLETDQSNLQHWETGRHRPNRAVPGIEMCGGPNLFGGQWSPRFFP